MFVAAFGLKFRIKPIISRFVSGEVYAEHLKTLGYSVGNHCSIPTDSTLPLRSLIRIGNNVRFSNGVSLLTYEGSIAMLNRAYGKRLDRVGPIVIRDNVFVGKGATIKYGVTLGPNVVVGANSIVTRSFNNAVVAGNPAKVLMTCDEFVAKVDEEMHDYSWCDLIQDRDGAFDPRMEVELDAARKRHFFPHEPESDPFPLQPGVAFG